MKWLKRKIHKWVRDVDMQESTKCEAIPTTSGNRLEAEDGLSIQIYSAIGGHVVRFNTYDNRKGHHDQRLYLISEEDDFNDALGRIITAETLRHA